VAREAGVDDTYLGRIERGQYPPPKLQTAHRIAEALGLSDEEERRLIAAAGVLPARLVGRRDGGSSTAPRLISGSGRSARGSKDQQISLERLDAELREAIKARQRGEIKFARYILQSEVVPGLRKVGDRIAYAEALTALGDVYRVERKYDDAETVFVTAKGVLSEELAVRPTNEARFFDAQLDWALTKISLAQEDVSEARVRIDRAWRAINQIRDHSGGSADPSKAEAGTPWGGHRAMRPGFAEGVCAQITARVYWAEGKPEEALEWFDRSLDYLAEADAPHTLAETRMYRLLLLNENASRMRVSHERLIDLAHETLDVGHSGPFPHVVAMVQAILAGIYKLMGLAEESRAHYENARQLKDVPELAIAHPDVFDRFQVELAAAA